MVEEDLRPSKILTHEAFENAIRVCVAIGGSTNAVVHLAAIARRAGIDLPLDRWDELSRETPLVASLRPSGSYQMQELFEAGGIPAVMRELAPLLHHDPLTVTGKTVGENLAEAAPSLRPEVVGPLATPFAPEGGISILRGNLAPDGAVIKHSAASPALLTHRGKAVVFDGVEEMMARVNDPELDVTAALSLTTPTGLQSIDDLTRRRQIVFGLNVVTYFAMLWVAAVILGAGGWTWVDVILFVCFAFGTPWTVLGFGIP